MSERDLVEAALDGRSSLLPRGWRQWRKLAAVAAEKRVCPAATAATEL